MEIRNLKYTAFKVAGLDHWLWFETTNVKRDGVQIVAVDGWGKNGHKTDLEIDSNQVQGVITSDELQYG
jgi:hypothetical protein